MTGKERMIMTLHFAVPDKCRIIIGTGDQVGRETPDENIAVMIDAGRRLGKCHIQ